MKGDRSFFEEGYSSYYQMYEGPGVVVIYFKNKFLNRTIEVS